MKKLLYVLLCITILTGCGKANKPNNTSKDNDTHLYYIAINFNKNTNDIIDLNVNTGEKKTLLSDPAMAIMLRYDDGKIYALFNNRVGYVSNGKITYITGEDEYVARYDVQNNKIYYGKDNNNASDNIFERFAMKDINGKNEKAINDMGVSQLVVGDYIYFKPNSGPDVNRLLRYNLDGTNKKVIYDKNIGQLILSGDYLYFIDYSDSSIYRVNKDGSNVTKMVDGKLTFTNYKVNQIDGYTNMGVIDNYLYYINNNDNYRLYKTDGTNNIKVSDSSFLNIYIVGNNIYGSYRNDTRIGMYLLDKTGKELKKLTTASYVEYAVNK